MSPLAEDLVVWEYEELLPTLDQLPQCGETCDMRPPETLSTIFQLLPKFFVRSAVAWYWETLSALFGKDVWGLQVHAPPGTGEALPVVSPTSGCFNLTDISLPFFVLARAMCVLAQPRHLSPSLPQCTRHMLVLRYTQKEKDMHQTYK